jgi:hypothetical protein
MRGGGWKILLLEDVDGVEVTGFVWWRRSEREEEKDAHTLLEESQNVDSGAVEFNSFSLIRNVKSILALSDSILRLFQPNK